MRLLRSSMCNMPFCVYLRRHLREKLHTSEAFVQLLVFCYQILIDLFVRRFERVDIGHIRRGTRYFDVPVRSEGMHVESLLATRTTTSPLHSTSSHTVT